MESYHVFAGHPKLLKLAPMNVRWSGKWNRHVLSIDYVFPELGDGRGDSLPQDPNLSEADAKRSLWFLCFRQCAIKVFPNQFLVLISYQVAPGKTREELRVFLIDSFATSEVC